LLTPPVGSGRESTKAFVGGEGVISGHIELASALSTLKELQGDEFPALESTRRKLSMTLITQLLDD